MRLCKPRHDAYHDFMNGLNAASSPHSETLVTVLIHSFSLRRSRMATPQAYELRTMPMSARPAAVSNGHIQSTMASTAIVNYSGLYPPHSSRFHPGLLSRARPEPEASFLQKLNSVYTATGLALTLILTCITYRLSVLSWELSQWTAQKDYHELCIELRQANLTLSEGCKTVLINGLARPPTFTSKRWIDEFDTKPLIGLWYAKNARSVQKQGDAIWPIRSYLLYGSDAEPSVSLTVGELHNVTLVQLDYCAAIPALGRTSFDWRLVHPASIALAIWMACSAVKYITIYLHRKHVKTISKSLETSLTDLRGAGLSNIDKATAHLLASQTLCLHVGRTWASAMGALLPQVHDFGLSLAILAVKRALIKWPTQVWSQSGVFRDRERDSCIALTTSDTDIGKQIRERKMHRADTSLEGVSRQGIINRHGRKRKSS